MTADLAPERFSEFFEEVTSHQPFAWQMSLVERLLQGSTPDVIDVPTGFGKTSVLHCWAYTLAAGGELPRRLCFVVDRRVVVDATYGDASELSSALEHTESGVVADVASRLRALHGDPELKPLEAVRMRGGVTWDSRWLARPDQAAVVVGTVDQFGSRLLLRGYGVSDRMRPIDAALVGLDTWLVVDEAHIAEALARMTGAVARYQRLAPRMGNARPLQVTQMSATASGGEDVLRADLGAEAAGTRFPAASDAALQRLAARKPAMLLDLTDLETSSAKRRRASTEKLGAALADIARQVDRDAEIVGVIANTIAAARAAHERLAAAGERACLLIGRTRPYERDQVSKEWLDRIKVGREPLADGEDRLFVVATQTIEVGANIDLDALVTECAPLSSLIQRFGRVNRVGARGERRSAIVHAGFAHGEDDRVYGRATSETWTFLRSQAGPPVEATTKAVSREISWSGEPVHFDIAEARRLPDRAGDRVRVELPFVPQLVGAHLERWASTSPAPYPDQSVEPYLHGIQHEMPLVSVAWRAVPPSDQRSEERWKQWLDLVRPVAWEFVDVPIWELRAFLSREPSQLPTSDLDWSVVDLDEVTSEGDRADDVLGVVYRGPGEVPEAVMGPGDVEAGDRIVLRSDLGGHDVWGWTGRRRNEDEPWVPDVADLAPTRKPARFRLVEDVVGSFVPPEYHGDVARAFQPWRDMESDWRRSTEPGIPPTEVLREAAETTVDGLRSLAAAAEAPALQQILSVVTLKQVRAVTLTNAEGSPLALPGVWVPGRRAEDTRASLDAVADEDLLLTSAAPRQTIAEHGAEVGWLARSFADHLGLPEPLCRAVELAGRWHDLGKADPRFQVVLHDGDAFAAEAAAEPLAKSGRDPRDVVGRRAWQLSGLPPGFRHEAVSGQVVRELAEQRPELFDGVDAELVHHLVVSHHGYARPLLRPVADPDPQKVDVSVDGHRVVVETADQVDWDHPTRFEALNERYGWWGLALLEALVRLADMRCSEVRR